MLPFPQKVYPFLYLPGQSTWLADKDKMVWGEELAYKGLSAPSNLPPVTVTTDLAPSSLQRRKSIISKVLTLSDYRNKHAMEARVPDLMLPSMNNQRQAEEKNHLSGMAGLNNPPGPSGL